MDRLSYRYANVFILGTSVMNEPPAGAAPTPPNPTSASPKAPVDESISSVSEAHNPTETQDLTPRPKLEVPPAAKPAIPESPSKNLPKAFGRYEVMGELGAGAFGTVYLGHDHQLDRPVAIKV